MEQDLDIAARAILVSEKIHKMLEIVDNARALRKAFPEEQKQILAHSHNISGLDELSIALGLARVSEEFFKEFESALYEIAAMARQQAVDALNTKNLDLLEGFIVMISQLKPRSLRHLENFFSAATDGEWVDGLFVAKGKDSEFRCIDQCSDDAREEFGLNKK